ncbi:MAG: tetratricopeptide repeat protein [Nitrospinota bacterium]|nr:tetratricopeptide repeat protein [Nitrospinota bacterium]
MRILIVSEKSFEIQQLRGYFEKSPYKIYESDIRIDFYEANSGKAAMEKLETDAKKGAVYDLLIISQKMKIFSGLQTAQNLAAKKNLPVPPILLVTEFIDKDMMSAGTKAGIHGFLKMPYNLEDFEQSLSNVVGSVASNVERNRENALKRIESQGATVNITEFRHKINKSSINELGKIKIIAPWNKKPYLLISRYLIEEGDFKTPITLLRTAIRIDFNDQMPHKLLKTCYRKIGMAKEELGELKKLLAQNPKSAEINARVGETLLQEGNYTKAAEFFKKAIANHKPTDSNRIKAKSHYGVGKSLMGMGDDKNLQEQAKEELNAAINVDPTLVLAYFNLISVYKKLGMQKEAEEVMRSAVKITPNTAKDWLDLFFFYLEDGDTTKAKFALNKSLSMEEENPLTLYLAGEAFLRQRMFKDAAENFEKSIEIYPSEIRSYNSLGICYRHLNEPKRSVDYYQKALQIDPKDFNVHYNLGKAFTALKDVRKATDSFQTALNLNPDLREAKEAIAQLENVN